MQRAEWQLESTPGRRATFSAQRSLSGGSAWLLACPHCGRPPTALVVCRHDHCSCEACSTRCSVCAEDFCRDHGIAQCRVDEQPACDEHVRVCPSRSEEHTSELQSRQYLVCRLLLEKKKNDHITDMTTPHDIEHHPLRHDESEHH